VKVKTLIVLTVISKTWHLCGSQVGNWVGDQWYNWPVSQWAMRVKYNLQPDLYAQVVYMNITQKTWNVVKALT
jgi:carbohydrate-selective porin OprB